MGIAATLLLFGAVAGSAIEFAARSEVVGPQVTLGDVAQLEAVPPALRARAAALPLLQLESDRRRYVANRADLVSRARALMPALAPLLPQGDATIELYRHGAMAAEPVVFGVRADGVTKGEALVLTIAAGPVRISRSAVALQSAEADGRLFVRTDDRAVIAARCCGGE